VLQIMALFGAAAAVVVLELMAVTAANIQHS
jgi:hypothetical protein